MNWKIGEKAVNCFTRAEFPSRESVYLVGGANGSTAYLTVLFRKINTGPYWLKIAIDISVFQPDEQFRISSIHPSWLSRYLPYSYPQKKCFAVKNLRACLQLPSLLLLNLISPDRSKGLDSSLTVQARRVDSKLRKTTTEFGQAWTTRASTSRQANSAFLLQARHLSHTRTAAN